MPITPICRDWNSVRERGMDGQWRWVNTPVDEPVTHQQLPVALGVLLLVLLIRPAGLLGRAVVRRV